MKLVTFSEIRELDIAPRICFDWVAETLSLKSGASLPKKVSLQPTLRIPNTFFNTMPCVIPQINRFGCKIVSRYPGREPSLDSDILLYDAETGSCLALMDGNYITTMRTGAVTAHSVNLLAVPDYDAIGFIGLGNTACATLLCLADKFPTKLFDVGLMKYKLQHEAFMERFKAYKNVRFRLFDTIRELAEHCQVIVSCVTAADEDFLSPEAYCPGTLIVPVHTRGFADCDLVFDKVYCDDVAHVSGFRHFSEFQNRLNEVSSVVKGEAPGRESDEERILAYNIGIALHDIYFASKIEAMIHDAIEVDLEKPLDRVWV